MKGVGKILRSKLEQNGSKDIVYTIVFVCLYCKLILSTLRLTKFLLKNFTTTTTTYDNVVILPVNLPVKSTF